MFCGEVHAFGKLVLDLLAERDEVVDRPLRRIGERHAKLVQDSLAINVRERVGAQRDAVELAVHLAGFELVSIEVGEVDLLADEGRQIGELAASRIFEDVAVIHLDDVGQILSGGLRRKLRPVVVPRIGFAVDGHAGIAGLVEVGHLVGTLVAIGIAPPDQAEPRIREREGYRRCERSERRAGRQEPAERTP